MPTQTFGGGYELQPTDPFAILQSAQGELNAERYEAAYRMLSSSLTEDYPILLAIRPRPWRTYQKLVSPPPTLI